MSARGHAASHAKAIVSMGPRHPENCDAQFGPSGGLLAFFAHIAATLPE